MHIYISCLKSKGHTFTRYHIPHTQCTPLQDHTHIYDIFMRTYMKFVCVQVLKVLELAKGMPYLIRGSAAGSLVRCSVC